MSTTFTPPNPLNTAVLFLVFNRPDTTKRVFEAIRKAKPPRLYIAADGARANKEGEDQKVQAVRGYILQNIDWDCEIKTLFRENNLGCKFAVSSAITWFFENEEQGIIIEDDCLPSQSFFWFCEELLEIYKEDSRVCSVSGSLRGMDSIQGEDLIYESIYFNMWGWATWKRVWDNYDVNCFDKYIENKFNWSVFKEKRVSCYWKKIFGRMKRGEIDTWDYQLIYLSLKNDFLNIYPKKNLVRNLGYGLDATHTHDNKSINSSVPNHEIKIKFENLKGDKPKNIDNLFNNEYSCKSLAERVKRKISRLLKK